MNSAEHGFEPSTSVVCMYVSVEVLGKYMGKKCTMKSLFMVILRIKYLPILCSTM